MEVGVLGPLEVHADDGELVALGGPACRAVMAMIALQPSRAVSVDELVDGLWSADLPRDPVAALQVTVSRLRAALGPQRSVVQKEPSGYRLMIDRASIDLAQAEDELALGRTALDAGDFESAASAGCSAVERWRGQPLVEFSDRPFSSDATTRLHLLRLALLEMRNHALIECGHFAAVLTDTAAFLATDPWQETLVEQLMVASSASGRMVDALAAYARCCSALQRDFGVLPSPRLHRLHERIVAHRPLARGAAAHDEPPQDAPSLPKWFQSALDAQNESDASVRARLLLALGEAQHHAGEAGWHDTLFEAGTLARDNGDVETLARAAMGGAAGWGVQAGDVDERRLSLLDAALSSADSLSVGLRARLLAARATELSYVSTLEVRTAMSDDAIELARASAEPATLLAVLNQRYSNAWSPENLDDRIAHLTEAARLSQAIEHSVATAINHGFLMGCSVEAADGAAIDDHLAQFTELAEELDLPMLRWGVALHSAWYAVLGGDLERAEMLNTEAETIGRYAHRPEAPVVASMQLLSIRWAQGRIGETVDAVETLLQWLPHLTGLRAFHALALHHAGSTERAAEALRTACDDGSIDGLAQNPIYLAALVHWAELAMAADDVDAATLLTPRFVPVADRFVFTGAAVYGPVAQSLAILAVTTGNRREAERHLRDADRIARTMPSSFFADRAADLAERSGLVLDR